MEQTQGKTDAERLQSLEIALEVLTQMVADTRADQNLSRAEAGALRMVAWATLGSSPLARELLARNRVDFAEAMRRRGLDAFQSKEGADLMEQMLLNGHLEPRRTLPAFAFGLVHDLLSTVDGLCRPSRWTVRRAVGVLVLALVVGLVAWA